MNPTTQPIYLDYSAVLRRVPPYDKEQVLACADAIESGVNRAGFACGYRSALEVVGKLATWLAKRGAFARIAGQEMTR